MPPFQIDYKLGQYGSSITVQADDHIHALTKAYDEGRIPDGATVLKVTQKGE